MASTGTKVVFWVVTVLLAAMMLFSAWGGLMSHEARQGFAQLGYSNSGFRVELSVAKFLGAIVLLVPFTGRLKEWTYFGFFIDFVSAAVSLAAVGMVHNKEFAGPFVALALLVASYLLYHRIYGARAAV